MLDQLKGQRGWASHLDDAQVFAAFMEVLGEQMRKHCKPTRLDRGELTVAVDSATWRQQLVFFTDELKRKLNTALGAPRITAIRLVHGRPLTDYEVAAPRAPTPKRALTDAERQNAAKLHDCCGDNEIGEIVAAAYLKQHETDR